MRLADMFDGGGFSVTYRPPSGEDRTDDVVQMWLDGDRDRAVSIALERSRMVVIVKAKDKKIGRPCTVNSSRVKELKSSGLCTREVAEKCECSVTHVNRIWRQCLTK